MRSSAGTIAVLVAVGVTGCGTDERILTDNVVDPQALASISRFRSCCGHAYPSPDESNRSMKHYLTPDPAFVGTDRALPVTSPCDGEIVSMVPEQHRPYCLGTFRGYQVRIVPRARPDVHVILFHVSPTRGPGRVDSGERIGFADLRTCEPGGNFDVAVAGALEDFSSYFEWLDDDAFAPWQARGLSTREAASISKAERDADPCNFSEPTQCEADTITFP